MCCHKESGKLLFYLVPSASQVIPDVIVGTFGVLEGWKLLVYPVPSAAKVISDIKLGTFSLAIRRVGCYKFTLFLLLPRLFRVP